MRVLAIRAQANIEPLEKVLKTYERKKTKYKGAEMSPRLEREARASVTSTRSRSVYTLKGSPSWRESGEFEAPPRLLGARRCRADRDAGSRANQEAAREA